MAVKRHEKVKSELVIPKRDIIVLVMLIPHFYRYISSQYYTRNLVRTYTNIASLSIIFSPLGGLKTYFYNLLLRGNFFGTLAF